MFALLSAKVPSFRHVGALIKNEMESMMMGKL
jgi:hypothetical protein